MNFGRCLLRCHLYFIDTDGALDTFVQVVRFLGALPIDRVSGMTGWNHAAGGDADDRVYLCADPEEVVLAPMGSGYSVGIKVP